MSKAKDRYYTSEECDNLGICPAKDYVEEFKLEKAELIEFVSSGKIKKCKASDFNIDGACPHCNNFSVCNILNKYKETK